MPALKERSRSLPHQRQCLVLNSDYRPLSTFPLSIISAQDAVSAIWRERLDVVETWPDAFFRSPSVSIPVPKIAALRDYAPISANPKFCRRSILLRDRFRCQYCSERFDPAELTYDHVIPRAAGGKTVWTNVVACCIACNAAKANSLPNFSARKRIQKRGQMRPLKEPRQPTTAELLRAGLEFLSNDLREDFGSFLYWSGELVP